MKKLIFCLAVMLLCSMPMMALADGLLLLNNGHIRFGTGAEDSVNNTGNLRQPFYFNTESSAWRKLTYSSYPLDFEIREGGDGTNWWNTNGSGLYNPVLTDLVIDASGHISYDDGTKGYGVVVSTGTADINGKTLEIRNTYEMSQTKAFVKVTTRFTNMDSEAMSNLRYWVGTRDDYVGGTDSPAKEKGNLTGGAFVQISSQTDVARSLRITSGAEGVLFYTDTDKANIIVGSSYGWNYIISRDPVNSPISITHDGSYAFYVRLDDLSPGESDEIVWYYAAGSISQLEGIIRDVAEAAGSVTNITYTAADLKAVSDVSGTGYYIVVSRNETAPSAAETEAGTGYGTTEVIADGSGAISAGIETTYSITGLEAGTAYDLYFVVKDSEGTYSSVVKNQFSTTPYMSPAVAQTAAATSITGNRAESGGNVSGDGGRPVTARGVVWSRAAMPTVSENEGITSDGTGMGDFVSALTGLEPDTMYYVRAYAVNDIGVSYGPQQVFTTADTVTHAIVYTAGANGRIEGDANQNVAEGGSGAQVTAIPDTGWHFVRWSDGVSSASRTDSDVTGNIYVTAIFALNQYTVTFNSAGGTETSPITQGYASVLILPDEPVKAGHTFLGWEPVLPVLMPPYNMTVTALWRTEQYTVTFDTKGGTEVLPVTQGYGTPLEAPEPPVKDGFVFNGWDPAMPGTMPEGGIHLKAGWTAVAIRSGTLEIGGVYGLDEAADSGMYAGKDIEVVLEIELLTEDSVPPDDLALIYEMLAAEPGEEDMQVFLLDISLYRIIRDGNGDERQEIDRTGGKITISVIIPEAYRGSPEYRIISVHDGEAVFLPVSYDPESHTLTFETDRFSTYAAAYTAANTEGETENPATGESDIIFILSLLLCLTAVSALMIRRHARRR